MLVIPDEKVGHVKIIHFGEEKTASTIKAHNTMIACMKLSQDGTILLTASEKGTLIRMFNTETGDMIREVRRGSDEAIITDLSIDAANKFICSASDKGTVHIFSVDEQAVENKKSTLSAMSSVIGYFGSSWSFS